MMNELAMGYAREIVFLLEKIQEAQHAITYGDLRALGYSFYSDCSDDDAVDHGDTEGRDDGGDEFTFDAWLHDVLDVERVQGIRDGAWETMGYRVAVALGGPNIWINTRYAHVEVVWGSERVTVGFSGDIADAIESALGFDY